MCATSTKFAVEPIQLDYGEADRRVVVTPENRDRFVTTVQEAAKACQAADQGVKFKTQFDGLLEKLGSWLKEHEGNITRAFVTIRDAGLLFLVVQKQTAYDRAFEDELTHLDIEIAQNQDFSLINLSVLALPNTSEDSYRSFSSPDMTFIYKHAS